MFGLLKRNAKYIVGNVRSESTDNTNRALIIDAINNSLCIPQSGFNKGKRENIHLFRLNALILKPRGLFQIV